MSAGLTPSGFSVAMRAQRLVERIDAFFQVAIDDPQTPDEKYGLRASMLLEEAVAILRSVAPPHGEGA